MPCRLEVPQLSRRELLAVGSTPTYRWRDTSSFDTIQRLRRRVASENNGGEWQAQGGDCPKPKGHRLKWSQSDAPTKADGIEMLGQLADICTRRQRALREAACADAKAYVEAAPSEGYPGFHMQSFYVKDPPKKAKGGRIDLEVITGMAFCDEP